MTDPEAEQPVDVPVEGVPEPLQPVSEAGGVESAPAVEDGIKSQIPWHLRKPTPEAPFGWTKAGVPKKSAAGRPKDTVRQARKAGEMSAAKKEAAKVVDVLLNEASKKLLKVGHGSRLEPDAEAFRATKRMTPETKAAVLASVVGADVDKFREQFANDLLETAKEMQVALRDSIAEMKPGERAFALSVLIDKGEQMRAKLASTGNTAQVNTQINVFATEDGAKMKAQILEALYPKTINVTPKKAD